MVRPCVLRHRVTVLTLCPLGEPEIAIGHEPRIEPWLPRNRIACQVSRIDGRCHHSKMNRGNGRAIQRRTSRVIESHLQTVGWISRQKISRLPAEGEAFLLTSLFIEPPISKCDGPLYPTPPLGVDCIALSVRVTWTATTFACADIRSRCIEPTAATDGGPIRTPKKPTAFGVSAKHSKSEKLLTPVSHEIDTS